MMMRVAVCTWDREMMMMMAEYYLMSTLLCCISLFPVGQLFFDDNSD